MRYLLEPIQVHLRSLLTFISDNTERYSFNGAVKLLGTVQSSRACNMPEETKIVIVGAGAAGIAAASKLMQKGINDFVILEANNRIGGRIHTKDFGKNVVDLGAQWVHGEFGNVVFEFASKHDLLSSFAVVIDPSKHEFVTINGEIMPNEESSKALLIYYNMDKYVDLKEEKGSFGDCLIREYYKVFDEKPFTNRTRIAEYLSWIEKMENSLHCSDTWFDISAKCLTDYWICEGDPVLNWKECGYKTIFDLLLQKIPNAEERLPVMEKIKFEKVVTTINYNSDENVTVTTKDGCEYSASHVIFTGSLGVLKEKHSSMFVPSLSQKKQRAIEGLNIGTVNKIFLEFPHRWWPEDKVSFDFIWPEKDKTEFLQTYGQNNEWLCDVFSFFIVAHQPNLLCAWIAGKNAKHMETLSDTDVFDGLYLLLKKSFEKHYNVVKPTRLLRSKWYTNEHFRGSYSFQSMVSERMDAKPRDLAEPIMIRNKPVILFAGEATHDHYFSTVHGAVETGFREADRIIDFERTCNRLDQLIDNFDETLRIEIDTNMKRMEKTRVVIVGAGIAGLAAAKTLEDAGFMDYLLFEAQDIIGGRIHSIPWDNGWIDCGAQFLHGDKSRLAQYCLNNDLLSNIQGTDGDGIFLRDDGTIMSPSLVREVDDLIRTVLDDICESQKPLNKQENIGSVITSRFEDYLQKRDDPPAERKMKEEIFDWIVRFLLVDNCCHSLDDLSAVLWGKFKYVGGPEHLLFKSGYSSLTNLIVDKLDKRKVRLSTPVETIRWRNSVDSPNDSSIIVKTFDGTQILADAVIVTCSLGYLKDNYQKMFQPLLPNRLSVAIEDLGFGTINKIFLDFGKPWWQSDVNGFQLLWCRDVDRSSLPEWTKYLTGFDVLPIHPATLIVWVGGRGACIIEELSEEIIAQDCMNLLTRYIRCRDIPPVRKCIRTKWNENRYVRGGYSHITKSCEKDDVSPRTLTEPVWATMQIDMKKKNLPIILFAGEATHDEFYSTTHGAYETGIYQAEVFLQHHTSIKECEEYTNEITSTISIMSPIVGSSSNVREVINTCANANLLIDDGTEAQIGEFPHMVALGRRDNSNKFIQMCGGTLISHSWVLSVAHCTHGIKSPPTIVKIGTNKISDQRGVIVVIKRMIRHPDYEPPKKYADIALIQLMDTITFSTFIRPACLYQEYDNVPRKAWVTGWGNTNFGDYEGSDQLQKTQLDIVDNLYCAVQYGTSRSIPYGITTSMICAGDPRGNWTKDSCDGDSGGPLQIYSEGDCLFQVIGIVSFGMGCGLFEIPGIYTRVSYYLTWIEDNVWPQ